MIINSKHTGGGAEITDGMEIAEWSGNSVTRVKLFLQSGKLWSSAFYSQSSLITVTIESGSLKNIGGSAFRSCTSLTSVDLSNVETIGGTILHSATLETVNFPNLTTFGNEGMSTWKGKYFSSPKATSYPINSFRDCTNMLTCELGSVGYTVTSINNTSFRGCTSSSLTITVFTNGNYANTLLSNIRLNATNATIIIKASEATTYDGNSYAAGDTMITSTP